MSLHFIETELQLPPFVVERDELGGGMRCGVEQRSEQDLGTETGLLVADGLRSHVLAALVHGPYHHGELTLAHARGWRGARRSMEG